MNEKSWLAKCFDMDCSKVMGRCGHIQEGMELQEQGRGLCISFSWLINDKTLIGALNTLSKDLHKHLETAQCHQGT